MKQEIEIILTLEVDCNESKLQIEKFITNLISDGINNFDRRDLYDFIQITSIKEESELYETTNKRI